MERLEELQHIKNLWILRDCDLLSMNQYIEDQDYKIRVVVIIDDNGEIECSSIVVGDRLVQDSSKYSMTKGCIEPILTKNDLTECLDKIKDIFGLPVEVEIHQLGE